MLGRFGKFTLVERIAEGGMAEVFKATVQGPEGFERIVAIKRLHRAMCEDADLTQMLVDEARITVQLNHPNIGNVFDLGCIENQYFLIMEYIDGTDLQTMLKRARKRNIALPAPAALFVVSETLSGLHYAHTKVGRGGDGLGIVHRDVSPQNIMITWDGRVKLVDFGIAKAKNRAQTTQHGIIKGKFYYMAPEQAHGHHVDARTDVFSAGMVLYESLVGHSPYEPLNEVDLLRHVRMADFPPPISFRPDMDPQLSALVEIATQRNPQKRFANAMEFQLALNDYRHRALGSFAEPQLARLVATIANASGSEDNFVPLDRNTYRPSEESLLFEKPDDEVLARVSGGGAIGNGRKKNPFADDAPTEIYDRDSPEFSGPGRGLPPTPGPPAIPGGGVEQRTVADRPSASVRPPPAPPGGAPFGGAQPYRPAGPYQSESFPQDQFQNNHYPEDQYRGGQAAPTPFSQAQLPPTPLHPMPEPAVPRAEHQTRPSMVDRVAKPKYVYAAIAFASVLVLALAAILYVTRQSEPAPEGVALTDEAPGVVLEPAPAEPSTVAVAFNSEPPNAQIFVDEVDRGTTPASVDLQVGKAYDIEIIKDGYEIARQKLEVSAEPEDVTVALEQARGVLRILSYPPDAVIFVDDEEQGATPLTLTGLETDQTYRIIAKLGGQTMERPVQWSDAEQSVQDVMFEFSEGATEAALKVEVAERKTEQAPSRKRTYRRKKTRTRPRPKPEPAASADDGESLDIFGNSSAKSEPSSDEDESLDVFGAASSSEKTSEPKQESAPAAKEEAKDDDEGFDIWGNPKKTSKKKKQTKKKPAPKKEPAEEEERLDIW